LRVQVLSLVLLLSLSLSLATPLIRVANATRTITFSGYTWDVKSSSTPVGPPGPPKTGNYWWDGEETVSVDAQGYLHLKVKYMNGKWWCSEVSLTRSLGWGKYTFWVNSRVDFDQVDPHDQFVVGGFFIYQTDHKEFDMEFTRWNGEAPDSDNGNYAVQCDSGPPTPYVDYFNFRLNPDQTGLAYSSHFIDWRQTSVVFTSIHGHYDNPPGGGYFTTPWPDSKTLSLCLPYFPQPQNERVHMNLYLYGATPTNASKVYELIIQKFQFTSYDTIPPSNPANLWSTSHTIGVWSSDNTVDVEWSGGTDDSSGVWGYARAWDTSPWTIPSATVDQTITYCISFPLSTGNSWYFHLRTVDYAGNWNPNAIHIGPFYIDVDPPTKPTLSYPTSGTSTSNSIPTFLWNPTGDSGSGVNSYTFQIDTSTTFNSGNLRTVPGITSTSYTLTSPLASGTWYWRVNAIDKVGNVGSYSDYWSITIQPNLPPASFDFGMSNNGGIMVTQGDSGSNTITVTLVSGSSQSVSLSYSGQPSGTSVVLNPSSGNPTFSSSCTIGTSSSTPTGSYTIIITGSAGQTHTTSFTLTVNSPLTAEWTSIGDLPEQLGMFSSVVVNDSVYIIGGEKVVNGTVYRRNTVCFAHIQSDGSLSSWVSTTPLPEERSNSATVEYADKIYVIGGGKTSWWMEQDQVWYASVKADGTIDQWLSTTSLPYHATGHFAFVCNGRMYVMGGWTGYEWVSGGYYSQINPDGSLGSWTAIPPLPEYRREAQAIVHGNRVYVVGGYYITTAKDTVFYADINSDGSVGTWKATTVLPKTLASHSLLLSGDDVYVIGGWTDDGVPSNSVFKGRINDAGTIDYWSKTSSLPVPLEEHCSIICNDRIYVMGGESPNGVQSHIYERTDLYTLPVGAEDPNAVLDSETILNSVSGQTIKASLGSTVSIDMTYQIWSSAGPGIIKQALLIFSWTPSWPPPSGYYIPLYNGQPGYAPGVTQTTTVQITVPSDPGTYYVWFGSGAEYSMQDAVNKYANPLSTPAHIKIIVMDTDVSTAAFDIADGGEYNVYFVYPDYQGLKPPGVFNAWVSDWCATGFMEGLSANHQNEATDTNAALIDTSSGAIKTHGETIVLFGGPLVNAPVHYYETNRIAPLYYQNDGGTLYWYRSDGTRVDSTALLGSQKSSHDMFVVESFIDGNGNHVFIVYGYGWKGTFAAGLLFRSVIYPNIGSYSNSWYVFRWTDANGDGFVDQNEIDPIPVAQG
jgi:N-acetylneuraminic acid mutarotase